MHMMKQISQEQYNMCVHYSITWFIGVGRCFIGEGPNIFSVTGIGVMLEYLLAMLCEVQSAYKAC